MRNLVLLALLATTASAFADPPKYTRKQKVEIDVKRSQRSKPIVPSTPPKHEPLTANAILAGEARAQPLRREQEAILLQLIADTPDTDPAKPDYMFRLAEHYAQQLRFFRLEAGNGTP